jgi:hypothetical protein
MTDLERRSLGQARGRALDPGTVLADRIVNRRDLERVIGGLE